jgi:hypothetical protein
LHTWFAFIGSHTSTGSNEGYNTILDAAFALALLTVDWNSAVLPYILVFPEEHCNWHVLLSWTQESEAGKD